MLSYQFYNLVHILGLVLLMLGIGGIALSAPPSVERGPAWSRRAGAVFHGLGIFLILLGGFGMRARLGIVQGMSWPGWVWVKIVVWGTLGVVALLPRRFPRTAGPIFLLVPVLAAVAAYMAIFKPL
ncbi:MAG TPA: hypothetical protein VM778_09175 [Gemmatimonadota bacterium]|nr:hypothetical protein [Gemmatimonadota bacterium]